jgi:serine/threonine protein kinase
MTNQTGHYITVFYTSAENKNMSKDVTQIGKYRLLDLLTRRRYTDVWLAEHIDLKKKVAIKMIFPQEVRAGNERLRAKKQFFNEARTLSQLAHPNIVQAFDYGEEEEHGWPYFVMEYAPYGSLAHRYYPGEQLPLSTVRAYTSQIGRAIHYVHTQGLIHRDIKPQNMFLKTRSFVLLGDFGLVMHNRGRYYPRLKWDFGGTRLYMAPEQEIGEPCPESDQYAFATIVFEWLTGRSPFDGNREELAWQRKNLLPPSMRAIVPEIPAAVERVVLTALQKATNRRFKTMLDFTMEFEEACRSAIVRMPYDVPASRSHRMRGSHHYESFSRHSAMIRRERSVAVARQTMFADEGHVLVAQPLHPAPLRSHRIEEELWVPEFTSDGEELQMVLPTRLQKFWSMLCNTWERIAGFFMQR